MGQINKATFKVHYEVWWVQGKCGNKEEMEVTQVDTFSVFDTIIVGVNLK